MTAVYNEIEPYAAQWLRNLIAAGHIAPGVVNTTSIVDLSADAVRSATQFHAFAGIGVWSHALRLIGWPDDWPIWTGSAPCQPWSIANSKSAEKKGENDARHLAPHWLDLIAQCLPPIIVGEQVASPDGRGWLADLRVALEALGYAVGAADLCAAGIGAPHTRQRLYFGAARLEPADRQRYAQLGLRLRERQEGSRLPEAGGRSSANGLGNADDQRAWRDGGSCATPQADGELRLVGDFVEPPDSVAPMAIRVSGVDPFTTQGFWARPDWYLGRDGAVRPTQPGAFPLVDGPPNRVGQLRAYGNAIVAPLAAEFLLSFFKALTDSNHAVGGCIDE